jgi:hypothetical protein
MQPGLIRELAQLPRNVRETGNDCSGEPTASNPRLIDGHQYDERRLTVDFGAFIERLETAPGLNHERLARYLAGADLIRGLSGPSDAGFGRATPGVSDEAEISEQLYAITDEAIAAAEDLMETVHTDQDDYFIVQADRDRQPELNSELRLALTELGNDGAAAARIALTGAPCAAEKAVAEEFI